MEHLQTMSWRQQFPALGGNALIYLDNAATTQKPVTVINAMHLAYESMQAPLYRGLYDLSEQRTSQYEAVRSHIAQVCAITDPRTLVFTRGATEALNIIAQSWLQYTLKAGDTVVITALEHHANSLPWYAVAGKVGAAVLEIPVNLQTLELDMAAVAACITSKTRLVSLPLSSNIRGTLSDQEISGVVAQARAVGAAVCFDASQVSAHEPLNIQKWSPDFCVWSGHKMFAPTGVGLLYVAKAMHEQLRPYEFGGGMVIEARGNNSLWQPMPRMLEAGTRSWEAVQGLRGAYDFLATCSYEEIRRHETALVSSLLDALCLIPGIRILGNEELLRAQGHMVTFTVPGVHAHDIALYLAHGGVAVRAGNHCCQPLHDALGIVSSVRVSFALYNTIDEVVQAAQLIAAAVRCLRI